MRLPSTVKAVRTGAMCRAVLCLLVAVAASGAFAETYRVTPDATAGSGDGLSWGSPLTLAEAIAKAAKNDVILVKSGVMATSASTQKAAFSMSKPLVLRGGLKGTDDVALDETFPYTQLSNTASYCSIVEVSTTGAANTNRFENIVFSNMKGGNIYTSAALRKYNSGSLALVGCKFVNNSSQGGDYRAVPHTANLSGSTDSSLILSNCTFEGNVSTGTCECRGQALCVSTFGEVVMDDCRFAKNGIKWSAVQQAATTRKGVSVSAVYANNAPIKARNCVFLANRAAWMNGDNGGCVRLDGAGGGSSFENCRWVGNTDIYGYLINVNYSTIAGSCTGGGSLVINLSDSAGEVLVKGCTVAMNTTDSTLSAAGITVLKGRLDLRDSIVANNLGAVYSAAAPDVHVASAGSVNVSNTMFSANAPSSTTLANATIDIDTMRYGDPLFTTPLSNVTAVTSYFLDRVYNHPYLNVSALDQILAFDVHLTEDSPALGLGCYAAAGEDPVIPAGTPAFGSVAVMFPEPYAEPLVTMTMAGEDAYLATVAVKVKVGGEERAVRTFCGIRSGDELTFAPPIGLNAGDVVTVEATATVPGVEPVTDVSTGGTVPGEAVKAPWIGVAGETNVIYVREGADGARTGLNWADAFTNVETAVANLSAERNEIWIAGDFALARGVNLASLAFPVAIRGGFKGGETSVMSRPNDDTCSVLDSQGLFRPCVIANGAGNTVRLERLDFQNPLNGAVVKTGSGDIEILSCRFVNGRDSSNLSTDYKYSGMGVNISGSADARAVVSNCAFEGCLIRRTGCTFEGAALRASTFAALDLVDTVFITNGVTWSTGFSNTHNVVPILFISSAPVSARRCQFVGNRSVQNGGVGPCVYLAGASGGSVFDHCLWSANVSNWSGTNDRGGQTHVGALEINLADATNTVDVTGCTIAYNYADTTAVGGGINVNKGTVAICDSIVFGNGRSSGSTGGADLYLSSAGYASIAYSIFTAKPGTYDSITAATAENLEIDEISTLFADDGYDPLFVTPWATAKGLVKQVRGKEYGYLEPDKAAVLGFDLHIKSPGGYWLNDGTLVKDAETPTSPALDAGNPTAVYDLEPMPNGSHVNMGFYGNSTNASMTAQVELEVSDVRTTFPTNWSRPHIEADLGGAPGYTASVTISCYTNDVLITSRTFPNHSYGDTVAWDPAIYLVPGDLLDVKVSAAAKGTSDVLGPPCETEVTGEIPPWNGKGGGESVIHVREGADGDATGLNWTDAYPTLEGITNNLVLGNLPKTYREIWIAGKILRAPRAMVDGDKSNTIIPLGPLNVRGGFDGHETAPEERTDAAARATLDGGYACPGLLLSNGASSPVTVERIVFTRGVHMGLWKTGAGDITVRDCRFHNNKRTAPVSNVYHCGRGVGADLEGTSGTTLAVVSNCVFEGNVFGTGGCDHGGGLYLTGLREADLSDCLFLTNGIPFGATVYPVYTGYSGGLRGAAVHASGAPVNAVNCRFVGNRSNANGDAKEGGGTVALSGACDGSSFVNCLWTGNEDAWAGYYNQNAAALNDSGALMVLLGDKEQTVELRNCTVAYNYADRGYAGAGVTVHKGTVNIVDSILYGNFGGTVTKATVGRDLTLCSSNAVANVRYSLLGTPDGLSASAVDPETLSTNAADGVLFGDPRFVTPYAFVTNLIVSQGADRHSNTPHHRFSDAARDLLMDFNLHLRGGAGYIDEGSGELIIAFRRGGKSPAIDAGDPSSDFDREPVMREIGDGKRVNLGFYGNTPWATLTRVPGAFLRVR